MWSGTQSQTFLYFSQMGCNYYLNCITLRYFAKELTISSSPGMFLNKFLIFCQLL